MVACSGVELQAALEAAEEMVLTCDASQRDAATETDPNVETLCREARSQYP